MNFLIPLKATTFQLPQAGMGAAALMGRVSNTQNVSNTPEGVKHPRLCKILQIKNIHIMVKVGIK